MKRITNFLYIIVLVLFLPSECFPYGNNPNNQELPKIPRIDNRRVISEAHSFVLGNKIISSDNLTKFDLIDDKLNSQILLNELNPVSSAVNPTAFSTFMVELGTGDNAAKLKKVKHVVNHALSIGKRISQLASGDLVSLPLVMEQELGETTINIIFNSAKIYSKFAEIEVYVKIEMPYKDFNDSTAVLYFGADDIRFSSENGLISGSVGLLSNYSLKLGAKGDSGMYFKKMEKTLLNEGSPYTPLDDEYEYSGTYINFDCDGFKEMGIGGGIFFSEENLIATDEFGNNRPADPTKDLSTTPRVHAHYQIIAQDFNDIFINVGIDHFKLKKWDKMSFYLGNANLDLSSFRNPSNVPYPHVAQIGNSWEGVYIEAISITLPKPFKRSNQSIGDGDPNQPPSTERIKISAEHLLIDEFGVYGDFSIVGQAPLIGGPIMDGEWGWSLDSIGISIAADSINSFGFAGGLGVPILSKNGPLDYSADWARLPNGEDKYTFTVATNGKEKFPIWNVARVNASAVATIEIIGDEFRPSVSFTGALEIGNPNDYADSQTGSKVKMPGITFENLKIQTISPYISVTSIGIQGGSSKVAGFPVTVTDPTLSTNNNNEVLMGFNLTLNLMDQGGGVSATGSLALVGEYIRELDGTKRFKYKRLDFNGAEVTISLPQFYAKGVLCLFEEDPTYGNGFSASVLAKVIGDDLATKPGKFNISMSAIFGSTFGYRYWMVDAFVQSDVVTVPIVPGVLELNGFGGGAFHHMKPSGYDEELAGGNQSCAAGPSDYCGIIYKPTQETKLGLKFSTSFTAKGGVINGLLSCILRFGNNFALQNITFWGTCEIMVPSKLTEKITNAIETAVPDNVLNQETLQAQNKQKLSDNANKIKANVGISLDFVQNFSFHAFAEVKLNVLDVVYGSGSLDILVHPGGANQDPVWHFYLGGYYDESVMVPSFFNEQDSFGLAPVSVSVDYGGFSLSANAYFLTGNDIPGPPPQHPAVAEFFGEEPSNRGKLSCPGRSAAKGTGVAFGAACFFDFEKIKKGLFGSCVGGLKVDLGGGIGFDLALLKYDDDAQCQSGVPIGGINGMRATGRVFAFVKVEAGHVTCVPLPNLGIGLKVGFDVIKPTYFQGVVVLDFIKKIKFGVDFGDQCGTPCSVGPINN